MEALACKIVIMGELDQRFGGAFEGLAMTTYHGNTRLTGQLADQAQLQGVLHQLFDLGLTVVSFTAAPMHDGVAEPDPA